MSSERVDATDELGDLLLRADRAFQRTSLDKVFSSRKAIIAPRSDLLGKDAQDALNLLKQRKTPSPRQLAALQQIIRLQRPAPWCRADDLTPLPDSGNWLADSWERFQPQLKQLQPSVARLERIDDPAPALGTGRTSLGSGFLVAPGVLLTAAHVVDALSFGTRRLESGMALADFRGYFGTGGRDLRSILDLIALDADLDLALLRIESAEPDNSRQALMPMKDELSAGCPVCVVGYPLDDPRNARALMSVIFENQFGVKRAALGEILQVTAKRLSHDCSTLGGNSGAPVINIATGTVCGVHVAGEELTRNEAVSGSLAHDFVQRSLNPPRRSVSTAGDSVSKSHRSTLVKPSKIRNFGEYYQQLQQMDSEIFEELVGVQSEMATTEAAGGSDGQFQLETIVLTRGRPVLDIRAGAMVVEFSEVESEIWKKRLTDANSFILPNIPAVGRIELLNHPRGTQWIGTGWLIRDNVVVTNRHVASEFAEASGAEFVFRPGFDGSPLGVNVDFLEEFGSSGSLEFPVFRIMHIEKDSGPDLAFLRIEPVRGQELPRPVVLSSATPEPGEQVAVIGYPARDPFFPDPDVMDRIFNSRYDKKRLAPGLVIGKTSERIFHDCSTLGGNSGAEVISLKTGHAVALHFAGTLFAKNHAVPIDVVASRLDDVLRTRTGSAGKVTPITQGDVMTVQSGASAPSGSRFVEVTIPIRIRVEIGDVVSAASDATRATPPIVPVNLPKSPAAALVVADDDLIAKVEAKPEDYKNRKGYNPSFHGNGFEVPLPVLTEDTHDILKFTIDGIEQHVLHYQHFSVVMSSSRRMCRFSACNIDGRNSKKRPRTGWLFDPRIPKEAQIMKECYGNEPKFSRGHMTRREDPVWGSDDAATLGNSDSMHVTNSVPQMQPFNAGVWLALEDYALDNARKDDMRICVFTGPFLEKNDPYRYGVKIPVTFWKVIAFIHDDTGRLCATGYTMSQKSFLREEEFVFSQHENHQRPIAEIERRAGISFRGLADLDPLRDSSESTPTMLTSLNQVRFF
jgi:endonuclease G